MPTPVNCVVPADCFGDVVQILEYLVSFKSLFDLELPDNVSLGWYPSKETFSDLKLHADDIRLELWIILWIVFILLHVVQRV